MGNTEKPKLWLRILKNNEYNYHKGKVPNKTYVSKRIESKSPGVENGKLVDKITPIRYASKVIDSENEFGFFTEKKEVKIRITPNGRQKITAKFLENDRGIYVLNIQKFTTESGSPHKVHFSFRGNEIKILVDFIKSIKELNINGVNGFSIKDVDLKKLSLTKEQAYRIYKDNEILFKEVLDENVTQDDILNLVYKKEQLTYFEKLLNDD